MDNILQIVRQEDVEHKFNRKLIDAQIRKDLEIPENKDKIEKGVALLQKWMEQDHIPSKKARIEQLKVLDLNTLVEDIFVGMSYVSHSQLFTSVTAQLAARLGFDDKRAAIQTIAEIVAVLCITDAFDITKEDKLSSLMIVNRLYLSYETKTLIEQSEYLPPMVCEPLELSNNYDSGYLTHKDSLILGKGNHHDGNICLDVLNTMNKVALKLDTDFLLAVEEEPTFELDDPQKVSMWGNFKSQSAKIYALMHSLGNEFYLTHKVDKRGRIYACGYHISTQGSAYKKAMIELANEEIVEGV